MKLDADDLIQKPYDEDVVVRKVREALRKSGRETHGGCAAAARTATSGQVVEIPGTMVKNRSVVTVSGKAVQLSDASLTALLRLLVAHVRGESVPLSAFGRDEQNGYKVVDRLRSALRGAVANPTAFVINCAGRYSLAPDVALGTVNTAWLTRRGNATITDLARELNPDQG
jgi:DNA-binding response OmpR family regulator